MNTSTPTSNVHARPAATAIPPSPREPHARDFGTRYGSSSGYARHSGYAPRTTSPRFRTS